MTDIRAAALHGAGIWPHGRDPLTLTSDQLDDVLVELGAAIGALQRLPIQSPPDAFYRDVAQAIRNLAAFVPDPGALP